MTPVSLPPSFLSPDTESPGTVLPPEGPAWVSAAALHFAIQRAGKRTLRRGLERLRGPQEEASAAWSPCLPSKLLPSVLASQTFPSFSKDGREVWRFCHSNWK